MCIYWSIKHMCVCPELNIPTPSTLIKLILLHRIKNNKLKKMYVIVREVF